MKSAQDKFKQAEIAMHDKKYDEAKRLAELPSERLWAQAMQDTRSFAEIRRAGR